ncbi:MAG: dUTP diphosphatase [Holosporales bacterium]|jgi:dUTP pyrophosphatase|nr:dUTP diphosphatase [Holosporales bacterium]
MQLKFTKINPGAIVPKYGTDFSAGLDMSACTDHDIAVAPGCTATIMTGIALEIPEGYFGMLCPRSGIAAKFGVTLLNSPGIIDSDYRGEVRAILINHSRTPFIVSHGMRVAQLIICPFKMAALEESENISESVRGNRGFGSTGLY